MATLNSAVCVAKNEGYDNSMGAYTEFYFWDGEQVTTEGGMYSDVAYNAYSVDATIDQIEAAGKWVQENAEVKFSGDFYGCTVILARSRKAPNGVELEVVDHIINRFGNEEIAVMVEGSKVWVSANTVKDIVKLPAAKRPLWAREERIQEMREAKAAQEQEQAQEDAQQAEKVQGFVSILQDLIESGATQEAVESCANILAGQAEVTAAELLELAAPASPVTFIKNNTADNDPTSEQIKQAQRFAEIVGVDTLYIFETVRGFCFGTDDRRSCRLTVDQVKAISELEELRWLDTDKRISIGL